MELDYKAIGKRIKIARIKKNLTQEAIADKIGITPQHVSNIETGNASVSLTTLVAIANTLTVSVNDLLCDTVLISKAVFEKEAKELFEDCNEYEIRVLVDVLKATKQSLRTVKLFEDKIEKEMEYALESGQFVMYLQPKYNIKLDKFCGSEALVRWQYTEKEVIYPGDFIPIFEKNGFIRKIDMYILEQACKEIRSLFDKGISPLPISVNFSRVDFFKKDFIENIVNICDRYKIPYSLIEIEITESSMFGDTDTLFNVSRNLQDIGFIVAMDDFGSGYSSVNMLKNIPLNVIKLDRGFFVDDKDVDKSQIVIKSIVSLIKQLGIRVVAEGIETRSQIEMLKKANCDIVQGYYFSKPLPIKEFEKLVYKI